jgi:hypothetical protein
MTNTSWADHCAAAVVEAHRVFDDYVARQQEIVLARQAWHALYECPGAAKDAAWKHMGNLKTYYNKAFPAQQQRTFVAGAEHGLLAKGMVNDESNRVAENAHKHLITSYMASILAVADKHVLIDENNYNNDGCSFQHDYAVLLIERDHYYILSAYDAWNIGCSEVAMMGDEKAVNALKDRVLLYALSKIA